MKKIVDTNAIKVYSSEIIHQWGEKTFFDQLNSLPDFIQKRITAYDGWLDRQLRVEAKLQLQQLLKDFNCSNIISLEQLKFTDNNRPYFETEFDFSTSHTGNMVFCAGSVKKQIGLDAEIIKEINLEDYSEYFTPNELARIENNFNALLKFYQLWTRKEALVKASGLGVMIPFRNLDVSGESIKINNQKYIFIDSSSPEGYAVSIVYKE